MVVRSAKQCPEALSCCWWQSKGADGWCCRAAMWEGQHAPPSQDVGVRVGVTPHTARVLVQRKTQVCLLLNSESALLVSSEVEGLKEGWKALGVPPVQHSLSLQLTAQKPRGCWAPLPSCCFGSGQANCQWHQLLPAGWLVAEDLGGGVQVSTSSQWQCQEKVTLLLDVALHWEGLWWSLLWSGFFLFVCLC